MKQTIDIIDVDTIFCSPLKNLTTVHVPHARVFPPLAQHSSVASSSSPCLWVYQTHSRPFFIFFSLYYTVCLHTLPLVTSSALTGVSFMVRAFFQLLSVGCV